MRTGERSTQAAVVSPIDTLYITQSPSQRRSQGSLIQTFLHSYGFYVCEKSLCLLHLFVGYEPINRIGGHKHLDRLQLALPCQKSELDPQSPQLENLSWVSRKYNPWHRQYSRFEIDEQLFGSRLFHFLIFALLSFIQLNQQDKAIVEH